MPKIGFDFCRASNRIHHDQKIINTKKKLALNYILS